MKNTITIYINNRQRKYKVTSEIKSLCEKACNAVLDEENIKISNEVSLSFVSDKQIHEINNIFRNIDKATDVLSFPLGEINPENGKNNLGDIIISLEHAYNQSIEYGHSFEREIAFLTVHSMLHLLGYDHVNNKKEEKIMFDKQDLILNKMGLNR